MISDYRHGDKKPSMSVDLEKGIYHCFSCGDGGTLKSLYYHTMGHGVRADLGMTNDDVVIEGTNQSYIPPDFNDVPYVNFKFEGQTVPAEKTLAGQKFLKKRGFTDRDAQHVNMKYVMRGLSKSNDDPNDKESWVWFTHRIIIPIYEQRKLISIEGRDIDGEEAWRESLKSRGLDPSKSVYKKVLFPKGSSTATLFEWEKLDKHKTLFIVEGLMDVLSLRTHPEMRNCTAYFSAGIGQRQLYLLDKFDDICVIPDNDKAGLMTLSKLQQSSIADKVSVMFPPDDVKDVNDILQGKCKNAKSIDDAVRKGWLTKRIKLNAIDIKVRERLLRGEL
jgi:DNA primase